MHSFLTRKAVAQQIATFSPIFHYRYKRLDERLTILALCNQTSKLAGAMTLTDDKFKKRYMTWILWHTQLGVGLGPNGCCDACTRSAEKASTGLWREAQETSLKIYLLYIWPILFQEVSCPLRVCWWLSANCRFPTKMCRHDCGLFGVLYLHTVSWGLNLVCMEIAIYIYRVFTNQ